MSSPNGSFSSIDEFFGTTNAYGNADDKKPKDDQISISGAAKNSIKRKPAIHHPRITSNENSNVDSGIVTVPTNESVPSVPLSTKSKHIESPQSNVYESDFDDYNEENEDIDVRINEEKKSDALPLKVPPPPPPPAPLLPSRQQHDLSKTSHGSYNSKINASVTKINNYKPRKQNFLPRIRPANSRKGLIKHYPKKSKNNFEARLLSAQNNKIKDLRSSLTNLRRQLEEERIETRTLHMIKAREDKALKQHQDDEYDKYKVTVNFTYEMKHIQDKIIDEREEKLRLQKELECKDGILRHQAKQMKFFEKLVNENLDESDELHKRLKEADKNCEKSHEKVLNQKRRIENLERNYRHEIKQELLKTRDLKRELEDNSKKYNDLLLQCDDKARQIGTMHIYIQRGGRRPSHSSFNLSKSHSLQSLQDESPRFREKIKEYDRQRREQLKQKLKLKPLVLPNNQSSKYKQTKHIPAIKETQSTRKPFTVLSRIVNDAKSPVIENDYWQPKEKPSIRRLSTPKSSDEDSSKIEQESVVESIRLRPPSAPSRKSMQGKEHYAQKDPIHKRSHTPTSPRFELKFSSLESNGITTTIPHRFKHTKPLSPGKRETDDKWTSIFNADEKEESTRKSLASKFVSGNRQKRTLITDTQQSSSSSSSSRQSSVDMFASSNNGHQKKPSTRITTTNIYDFEQDVTSLPINGESKTTKTSSDPFKSLFNNNTKKATNYINGRDDTFTTTEDKSGPFDLSLDQPMSATTISTTKRTNSRQYPPQNDKLLRPKIVTNTLKSIPSRAVAEEIEEFVL